MNPITSVSRLRRRAPRPAEPPTGDKPASSLQEARDDCVEAVWDTFPWFFRFFRLRRLVKAPPGIGKTEAWVEAANAYVSNGFGGHFLYIAATHNLLAQTAARLTVEHLHVKGRTAPGMCLFPDEARAMAEKEQNMTRLICDRVCPHRRGCRYFEQFERSARIWLVTPQMSRSRRVRYETDGGQTRRRPWVLVTFDDVSAPAAFVGRRSATVGPVLHSAGLRELASYRVILMALAELVADTTNVWTGRGLYDELVAMVGGQVLRDSVGRLQREGVPREPIPDLPGAAMPSLADVEGLPPAFVEKTLEAVRDEGAEFLARADFNPCMEVGRGRLSASRVERPEFLDHSRVLILDATADQAAWEHALRGRVSVYCDQPVAMPTNVEILQIADYFSGKQALSKPAHRRRRLDQIDKLMPKLPSPIVMVTFQQLENEVGNAFARYGAEVEHYYSLRGMNDLQHARSLVVLGCPTPRMDGGLLQQLAAFYLGEPVLDAGWDMTPERYLTPGDQGHWEVEVRRYNDARVDSAFRSRRESELFQVVHRARPLIRSGRLNIVIVTEQPIPGLPVHLTGVGHVYCPELDDVTAQVFEGARVAMRLAQAKGREAITTGDIAEAAGMSRSRTFRRKVRDRARELYYHLGLEARKAIRGRALRNGGRGSYEEFEFTWIESGSRPPP